MTNDAKLGMLVGVLGVIVAAVLLTNPAPPVQSQPSAAEAPAPTPAPAVATVAPPEVRRASEPLASTPVARTRKEAAGQSTSRSGGADEEP
jgi:hypothetical protein